MQNDHLGVHLRDFKRALRMAVRDAEERGIDARGRAVLVALLSHPSTSDAIRAAGLPEGTFRRLRTRLLRTFHAKRVEALRFRYLVRAVRKGILDKTPKRP